ncbi:MAG: FkbM family methyltransferase [Halioglobus sp.]
MKKVVGIINALLSIFGIRLVSTETGTFTMPDALKRAATHHPEISTVIDIGASNGCWSEQALRHFKRATVLAIEPLKERHAELDAIKRKHDNFNYEPCVAGAQDNASVSLNVAGDLDGSTVGGSGGKARTVPGKTLDSIVAQHGLTGPFLLKFDTHGYELPILEGAQNTLQNTDIIIMETYNFKLTDNCLRFHEMCAHMEELGFRCYDAADPMLRKHDEAFWQIDLCFARETASVFSHTSYR